MMNKLTNEKGFLLAEFVIALPLLILLIYTLTNIFLNVRQFAKNQAADYVLAEEAHEILERISKDARSAYSVKLMKNDGGTEIIFVFHADAKNSSRNIIDVLDKRKYVLYVKKYNLTEEGEEPIYHIYAHREFKVAIPTSPTSGDMLSADTTVTKFDFDIREEKILHISLEIKSLKTKRTLKMNTSVFMPACEKILGDFGKS